MGVVGCILGFLVVIYLCYKDWSVYVASIVGAAVVIAFNVLPFMDTLLGSYVNGMFVPIKSFFFLLLFRLAGQVFFQLLHADLLVRRNDHVLFHLVLLSVRPHSQPVC